MLPFFTQTDNIGKTNKQTNTMCNIIQQQAQTLTLCNKTPQVTHTYTKTHIRHNTELTRKRVNLWFLYKAANMKKW